MNPNADQDYYWFRNTTDSTIIVNDLTRPASIGPRQVSRSFTPDEVRQSSDLRRFYELGILTQEETPPDVLPPLRRSIPARILPESVNQPPVRRRAAIPDGVDVQSIDEKGNSYISSQGTEFVNPLFAVGDFVHLKGPSGLSGRISSRKSDGRWQVQLQDGRVAYAYEESMLTVDQYAVSSPAEPTKTTLSASEVLKRNIVTPDKQRRFAQVTDKRMSADAVMRNRTSTPASQLQGKPARPDEGAAVSGRRFTTDEVKGRPPVEGGVEIMMPNQQIVNSETLVSDKLHGRTQPLPEIEISDSPTDQTEADEDRGTIIVSAPKNNPLDGAEVTPQRLVRDTVKSLTKEQARAAKKREYNLRYRDRLKAKTQTPETPAVPKGAPAHVSKFLSSKSNEQKFHIARTNSVEKLQELAQFVAADQPVRRMLDERIAQLQIA